MNCIKLYTVFAITMLVIAGGCSTDEEKKQAHYAKGQTYFEKGEYKAAKIELPRMLRNLKNDAVYREGRADLDENGNEILKHRELRAIHKRTEFGQALRHISLIEHEFSTLQMLSQAGADVPAVTSATPMLS